MPISAPEFPAPTRRTPPGRSWEGSRSEEHTSELQSPYDLVCRLLLEKKKNKRHRCERRCVAPCGRPESPSFFGRVERPLVASADTESQHACRLSTNPRRPFRNPPTTR